MPIYSYRCDKCGHQFDELMRMSDPNPTCPKVVGHADLADDPIGVPVICGCSTTKLLSAGSFQLKGSGWASDGYT